MKEFEVWMEGYLCTGNQANHKFIGKVKAETFEDACYIAVYQWLKDTESECKKYDHDYSAEKSFNENYDKERCTFWGCRCFDNEKDSMFFDK